MNKNENSNSILFIHYMLYTNSFVNVFQFGFDRLWVSSREFIHDIFQSKVPISVFDEVNAILKTTGVAVLGLNSNCVELVLRSVGDQHVSEATVIRFRCSSERIEKFGEFFFWEMKCHPVCPFSIARSPQGRQAKRSGCSSCSSSCGGGRRAEGGGCGGESGGEGG